MAPQNQSITLSLNLNCARATKAWRDLQKSIAAGEQELAEMHKKVNGTSYADLFPDVEKALQLRLKNMKNLMKRFEGDYADLNAELVHIQTQSTARLKTLLADTQARMDSLNFKKQRKEWMDLAKIRGEFEREMKARQQQQTAMQSRAQERIMRELRMTEQEIETQKKLQLTFAESVDKQDKYQRSIDRINKAKIAATKYTQDLAKAQQDLTAAQAALAAAPTDPTAIANVASSQEWVNELLAHPKKMPSAMTEANAQRRLATAQTDRAAAEAAYNQFMKNTGNGPIQGSIIKLRSLYQELEQLRNAESDPKRAKVLSGELEAIKKQIDSLQTAPIRNLKTVLNDISNAQSLQQLQTLKTELSSIMHNSTNMKEASRAKRELEQLEERIKNYGQEYMKLRDIKKVVAQGDQADVQQQQLAIKSLERLSTLRGTSSEKAREYKKMIDQIRNSTKGLAYDQNFISKSLKNIKSLPYTELERAIKMCDLQMKNLDRTSKAYTDRRKEYIKLTQEMNRLKGEVEQTNQAFKRQSDWLTTGLKKLMNYLGVFGGFYLVRQQVQKAFEMNIKYDDSLSNIRKTTGLTSEAVAELADNIKKINTRTSLADMTDLAYTAGRLGVHGAADIMGFVRAANQINVALGEQLKGKEAVEQLMKLTELMGTNDQYGLEEALLRTGSAINKLTMETQASGQPVVDFMRRTAGIATQSGVTTAQLTGLAGAVNALGQNVEMSATSISKMFMQISSNSKKVASALKMTAEETERFMLDISTGNMMEAFMTVLQKTNEAGGLSHLGTIVKDLGSEGQRVIQTIATLSSNYQKVREMVDISTAAFEKGTSATEEYNIKNQNVAALWEKLKNAFSKEYVSSDMIEFFKEILVNLQDLPIAVKNIIDSFSWLTAILKGLITIVAKATWVVETFAQVMVINTVYKWGNAVYAAWLKASLGADTFAGKLKAMDVLTKKNVFLAIAAAVLALYHAFTDARRAAENFKKEIASSLESARTQYQAEERALNKLIEKQQEYDEKSLERKNILTEINAKYGEYLDHILTEADSYESVKNQLEAVNEQLRMKATLAAKADSETNIRDSYSDKRGQARGKLVDAIMKKMVSPDRQAAADIADSMIENRDNILVQEYSNGKLSGYDSEYLNIGGAPDRMNAMLSSFGSVRTKSSNMWSNIFWALEELSDLDVEMENKIQYSNELFDSDARRSAKKANEYYSAASATEWKDVADMVTRGGVLVNGKKTSDINSSDFYAYATQADADAWARQKQNMSVDDRNELIEQLDEFIKMQRQNIADQKVLDPQKAREQQVYLSNAEWLRKIMALGQLEQKPDKNKKNPGKDEYNDIIAKIEAFYKIREEELRRQYNSGDLTNVQYQRAMDSNADMRSTSLRSARRGVLGDDPKEVWQKQLQTIADEMLPGMGAEGAKALQRIIATGDLTLIGDHLRKKATKKDKEGEESSALMSEIRLSSEKDQNDILERARKTKDAIRKMWLEDNPFGGLVDKYQERFEQMGIMLANLHNDESRSLEQMQSDVMKSYLKIGQNVSAFNIQNEMGLRVFQAYLMSFPDLAEQAATATDEQLKAIYYESYEMADEFSTRLGKVIEKDSKNWDRLYKLGDTYKRGIGVQDSLEYRGEFLKSSETYGGSARNTQKNTLAQRWNKLETERGIWENRQVRAQEKLDAAEGMDENDPRRQEAIDAAKRELEEIQKVPDAVSEAIQGVIDEMTTLNEMTYEWVADMKSAFEEFMDGFIPFRSWNEDKGSFAKNVFGTEEELREASGQFMDNVKKTIRKSIVEYVSMKTQEQIIDRMASRKKLLEDAKASLMRKGIKQEELTHEKVIEEAKVIAAQEAEQKKTTASATGSAQREGNDVKEATTGMWGNFGKAMTAAWADGGPFLGAVLSAVVGAALGAVMTMVFNMIGSKSKGSASGAVNTKLVSGMLTYDRGNVQSFAVRTYDAGAMPVMGDNGKVYMATPAAQLGTGMVTRPTLTTIGGAPALVGEEGPEMVIGRETTRAIMMDQPNLMRIIMEYDRNRSHGRVKTYDNGNVQAAASASEMMGGNSTSMIETMSMLAKTLDNIQRNGIAAHINKYGRGGLIDEVASGVEQMNRTGQMQSVKRAFGR